MTHGHEVLAMMEGHLFTRETLLQAIKEKFGADERFYTCHAENLTAEELVDFLSDHGKFRTEEDQFTVDTSRVCNH